MKVVAINGSARKDGNTAILIRHLFAELEREGIETELVQLAGHVIRGCTACNQCQVNLDRQCVIKNDIVNEVIAKFSAADGIILGSPTYFADITAELKALIDRAGRVGGANGGLYRRKIGAGVIAVRRGGAIHALDTIHHFLHIAQMVVPGASYWNVGIGREIGEVEKDEEGLRNMRTLGENIAWLLKLTRDERKPQGEPRRGIHHISVHTEDLAASLRFYQDLLGMRVVNRFGNPERQMVLLDSGDGSHIELTAPVPNPAGNAAPGPGPLLHLALRSQDVRAVVEQVRRAGHEITVEPKDVQLGPDRASVAFAKGPSGELVEFFQTHDR
ncbi:NAD(P)H-dependent oxidoreductase [Geomesophilobacter sediminis]|uniref:NAD(P)H-dependent oxidoreductase n=1 Tax=Geomesophilobacter sediminis TaxID=2798584 RepID=A0A8J7J169_9BACT|nr:NAD(P)H-dependent oxidoreductase [Geomesophilobacter sediminis]MBJ6724348.1 NAD(P)H-dependent oxidoreductase [Geomesophilobacter sediminis]